MARTATLLRRSAALALTAVAIGATAAQAASTATVSSPVKIRAHVEVDIASASCTNKGSSVEISGTIATLGTGVKLTFRNNVIGTHEAVVVGQLSVPVTPASGTVTLPKSPASGGVGGNPWISFELKSNGVALMDPIVVGRCVQGSKGHVSKDVDLPASLASVLTAIDCSNKGSSLTLDSSHVDGGLTGRILFDNNINKVVHEAEAAAKADVVLTMPRTVKKGGTVNAAGGNPLVYANFVNSNSENISPEVFLGRCNKLGA